MFSTPFHFCFFFYTSFSPFIPFISSFVVFAQGIAGSVVELEAKRGGIKEVLENQQAF